MGPPLAVVATAFEELEGVLFDLDGTLVDQESAAAAAVVEWAAEHGITDYESIGSSLKPKSRRRSSIPSTSGHGFAHRRIRSLCCPRRSRS